MQTTTLQASIPLAAFREEMQRRAEMIRRQRPFGGKSVASFAGAAQAKAASFATTFDYSALRMALIDVEKCARRARFACILAQEGKVSGIGDTAEKLPALVSAVKKASAQLKARGL